jgi:hypothetical protein
LNDRATNQNQNQNQNQNIEPIQEDKKTAPRKRSADAFDAKAALASLGLSTQLIADWLQVRKVKKAPLTKTALDDIVAEAKKAGITPAEAIAHSAKNSWQGFKASWLEPKAPNGFNPPSAPIGHDPDSRSAIEAEGIAMGIGPWNELTEQWASYKRKVRGPAKAENKAITDMIMGGLAQ